MLPPSPPHRYILIDKTAKAQAAPEIPSDPIEFARLLGFEPDAKQIEILASRAHRGMINGSRQCGKSTILALLAVHRALTEPKSLVLLVGPYNRQSAELLGKVKDFLEDLDLRTKGDGRNKHSIRLPNRSRIVAVPGVRDRVRGYSAVKLLIIDEAAFLQDSTYTVVRPMLAVSGGDLWLISTPFGRRGFFYKEWTSGNPKWQRFSIKATECPRIPADYLEEEREAMTESEFRQEFCCEFVDPSEALFRMEVLLRAINPNVDALVIP